MVLTGWAQVIFPPSPPEIGYTAITFICAGHTLH